MRSRLYETIEYIMNEFHPIGGVEGSNGVTRLAYTEDEDRMHEKFLAMAKEFGLNTTVDEVGNSYAYIGEFDKYHYIGSHLDSVIDGGRYDGVIGVAAGLAIMKILVEDEKFIPIKTVAFRCEESANFMNPLVGSSLKTGVIDFNKIKHLESKTGKTLGDIFKSRGYSENPKPYDDVIDYIELHIEQGRVLEDSDSEIGIVDVIAGSVKVSGEVKGLAEHAGATPMNLRSDSLAAVAEIILEVERLSKKETKTSVGTVGYIENYPNAMNVVPGVTKFSIDIRDVNNESMEFLRYKIVKRIDEICDKRKVTTDLSIPGLNPAVKLSTKKIEDYKSLAIRDGYRHKIMPSGAGHDCGVMARFWDSILIFVPCKNGISHNPLEYVSTEEVAKGADIIMTYLVESNVQIEN